jgi:hypothetical protein
MRHVFSRQLNGMKAFSTEGEFQHVARRSVIGLLFCSRTPRCNFFSTFYPEVTASVV